MFVRRSPTRPNGVTIDVKRVNPLDTHLFYQSNSQVDLLYRYKNNESL